MIKFFLCFQLLNPVILKRLDKRVDEALARIDDPASPANPNPPGSRTWTDPRLLRESRVSEDSGVSTVSSNPNAGKNRIPNPVSLPNLRHPNFDSIFSQFNGQTFRNSTAVSSATSHPKTLQDLGSVLASFANQNFANDPSSSAIIQRTAGSSDPRLDPELVAKARRSKQVLKQNELF